MQKFKNADLEIYRQVLDDCLEATGVVGFAVAHNYRVITNTIQDYLDRKQSIIMEYGEDIGNGLYSVTDPEKIEIATAEIAKYGNLMVECDIMTVTEEDFKDCNLTAKNIYNLQLFMMEDLDASEKKDESRFEFN